MAIKYYAVPTANKTAAQEASDALYGTYVPRPSIDESEWLYKMDENNLPAEIAALGLTAYGMHDDEALSTLLATSAWTDSEV